MKFSEFLKECTDTFFKCIIGEFVVILVLALIAGTVALIISLVA